MSILLLLIIVFCVPISKLLKCRWPDKQTDLKGLTEAEVLKALLCNGDESFGDLFECIYVRFNHYFVEFKPESLLSYVTNLERGVLSFGDVYYFELSDKSIVAFRYQTRIIETFKSKSDVDDRDYDRGLYGHW